MPTYGRPAYVNEAIQMFLEQDYPRKELIVLNDCPGQVYTYNFVANRPRAEVRVVNHPERYPTLGEKRNACIELAQGELIAVWDDDDVYLPWRLSFSLEQMRKHGTSFYRAAEFWAYWGKRELHDNQSVPGWLSHPNTLFTKGLWETVGGYPTSDVGEDAQFFAKIHSELSETFITYPVCREDRFFLLRGKSQYPHMSIDGGSGSLNLRPGEISLLPKPIADPVLRGCYQRLVDERIDQSATSHHTRLLALGPLNAPVLSICVSLKNRTCVLHGDRVLPLFPNCVESLATAAKQIDGVVELVVADFESDDVLLDEWIHDLAEGLQVRIAQLEGEFSRGRGLNEAVKVAHSDRLLLCDADILIDDDALRRAIELVDQQKAWFPICRYLNEDGSPAFWQDFGHGIVAVNRGVFDATGGVPEFESWGGEDNVFSDRVQQLAVGVRERCGALQHQWHPDSCRDENYRQPRKLDFYLYQKRIEGNRQRNIPLLIGLGTGRCGTASLATLLGVPHEFGSPAPWEFSEFVFRQKLNAMLCQEGHVAGGVAFYHLNYIEAFDKAEDCRFVCMQRDRQEVIESYERHVGSRNHWMEHTGDEWDIDPKWDQAYPAFDFVGSREEAIGRYWDSYSAEANRLEATMPNFRIFDIDSLNTPEGRREILNFAEVVNAIS